MKLVRHEPETPDLVARLGSWTAHVTSVVGEVEVRRAAQRDGANPEPVLAAVALIQLDDPVRRLAGTVGSPTLRSLDAIHLATALSLGEDIDAFCCYDQRLITDAEAAGLTVISPGLH